MGGNQQTPIQREILGEGRKNQRRSTQETAGVGSRLVLDHHYMVALPANRIESNRIESFDVDYGLVISSAIL